MPTRAVLALVVFALSSVGFLLLLEIAAEKHDLVRYPAPGSFATERRLHILEKGTSGPHVILESGLAASSISWLQAQQAISEFAHVVSYDRAGLGWSAASPAPLSLNSILADLDAVVKATAGDDSVILVGHSFGGLIVSAYANHNFKRVAGVVLVDPVSLNTYATPDQQHAKRLALAASLCKRGAWLARLGVVRGALALVGRGKSRLPLLIGRVSAGKGSSVMSRLAAEIAKLPPQTYGPIRSHWSRPQPFLLLAKYLRLLPEAARQAQAMPIPQQIPVIVLSAASATEAALAEREGWIRNNRSSRHTQIPDTTHWIQLDRPDVICESVQRLIIE